MAVKKRTKAQIDEFVKKKYHKPPKPKKSNFGDNKQLYWEAAKEALLTMLLLVLIAFLALVIFSYISGCMTQRTQVEIKVGEHMSHDTTITKEQNLFKIEEEGK